MIWWHHIVHALGMSTGHVVSVIWKGTIWVGFRCDHCGKVLGKHPAGAEPPDEEFRL